MFAKYAGRPSWRLQEPRIANMLRNISAPMREPFGFIEIKIEEDVCSLSFFLCDYCIILDYEVIGNRVTRGRKNHASSSIG